MSIKNFKDFTNKNTLYVFDLDDTLVVTPKFEDLVIEYLKENKIEDILKKYTKKVNIDIKDLKWENGRVFFNDPNSVVDIPSNSRNWVRKGGRVYLISPDEFRITDISLPIKLKRLVSLYNSVENRCIITARPEEIRSKIENTLLKLGLEYPNYGIHMYPHNKYYQVGIWKGNKIVELVNNFNSVIFYDDNAKYIKSVNRVIREKLPHLNFKSIKV